MLNPISAFKDPRIIMGEMYVDNDLDDNPLDCYVLQYKTDAPALKALMPCDSLVVPENPVISILFMYLREAGAVAGGDMAISCVLGSVRHEGKEESVDGNYILVMPEDNNYNVDTGRDFYGAPKIVENIPERYITADKNYRLEVTSRGNHLMYGININRDMVKADEAACKAVQAALNGPELMQYKYIFNAWERKPELEYLVAVPTEFRVDEMWTGTEGSFLIGEDLTKELIVERAVANMLKTLPVKDVIGTIHFTGNLKFCSDRFRILK